MSQKTYLKTFGVTWKDQFTLGQRRKGLAIRPLGGEGFPQTDARIKSSRVQSLVPRPREAQGFFFAVSDRFSTVGTETI